MYIEITELKGKTLTSVVNNDNEEIVFTTDTGEQYKLYHEQDCCENVTVEDITGDLQDLVGTPLLMAEQVSNEDTPELEYEESYTWTFYKFATVGGYVTIRWLGTSNGYYSEGVDFAKIG
jgi:hypothetical protein